MKENREFVTVTPVISLGGSLCACQVIFAAKGIISAMAPESVVENIPNLLISTTENGYQDQGSFFDFLKCFDNYLTEKNITRPVLLLSDGHTSRFNFEALTFAFDKGIKLFLGPPDSTSVTQALDQISAVLHKSYGNELSNFYMDSYINRETFMTEEGIKNAFRKCGISIEGLSADWMQQDKFLAAENIIQSADAATPVNNPAIKVESPMARKGSLKYYKQKLANAETVIENMSKTIPTPEEGPGFFTQNKVRPTTKKPKRVTQVHGSLEGKDILKILKVNEDEKAQTEELREMKLKKKVETAECFKRCMINCECDSAICAASGLRQCPQCKEVLKSQCSKKKCQVDGKKTVMLQTASKGKAVKPKERPTCSRKLYESDEERSTDDEDIMFETYYLS